MAYAEPRHVTQARRKRAAEMFPALGDTDAGTQIQLDDWVAGGNGTPAPVSNFTQLATALGRRAAEESAPEPTFDAPDAAPNVAGWTPNQTDERDPYGIRAPYVGPPAGTYDAASSPSETLRNVAGVFNPFSENSVFGSFYQGENPVLQELARPSNYVGAGGGVRGLARGALSGIGGRVAGELAMEAVPEDAPEPLRIAAGLVGGLAGGVAGFRAIDDVPRIARTTGTWMEAADNALAEATGATEAAMRRQAPEAFQFGRTPETDELFTFGPQGERVGPTGAVREIRLGREPRMGENVNAGLRYTRLGRAEMEQLADADRAAFQSAYDRSIAGAERGIGGGAPARDISRSARAGQMLGDDAIAAIRETPGATINADGTVTLDVVRYQRPEQAGAPSVRAGVFYMPEAKSPYERHFKAGAPSGYGGAQRIQDRTTFRDPLLVQAAAGGKAPEAAYDFLKGKKAYESMRSEVLGAIRKPMGAMNFEAEQAYIGKVETLLEKYGVNPDEARWIIQNSKGGNLLPYALQERIVSQAVQDAGYDGVIGYSKKLKGAPRLTEVFDVRRDRYPVPGESFDPSEWYAQRPQPPVGGGLAPMNIGGGSGAARRELINQATESYVSDALPKNVAGFIRPDGTLVALPRGVEHDAFAKQILGPNATMNDLMDEGWVTVRQGLSGPQNLVVRVGRQAPTPRQLRALDAAAGAAEPGVQLDYYLYGPTGGASGQMAQRSTLDRMVRDVRDVYAGRQPSLVAQFHIGGGADITPDEFARLAAKKAAGEALTPEEQDSVLQALGKAMGATTADEQAAAREALYNGPVPTDMREVDTGLIEGVRRRLGAPTGATVEDALRRARGGDREGFSASRSAIWDDVSKGIPHPEEMVPSVRDIAAGNAQPRAFYRAVSDAELEAAQRSGRFSGLVGNDLYITPDPDRIAGGAYGAKGGGAIVEFDPDVPVRLGESRNVRLEELLAQGDIPMQKVRRIWNWDESRGDHVLSYERPTARQVEQGGPAVGGGAQAAVRAPMTSAKPTAQTYTAPPTLKRLFGAREVVPGEQRGMLERVAEEGRFRADEPIVTPALRVRAEARRAVENQATRVTAQARTALSRAFETDADGRIASLAGIDPEVPGAPTIRDVAARLPRYEASLTPGQRQALEQVRDLVAPYRQALDEVAQAESAITGKPSSIKIGSRADVLDGGFYIPRGTAETEELADIAARRVGRGGGRVGGKQGFEKSATFGSEAEGIEAGYRYTPIDESLASYVRGAGNRALDRHTANYFLTRVDESGQRLAQSRADRLDPTLRADVESLRQRITSRLQTLRNQTVRGRVQEQVATGAERESQRLERLAVSAETRAMLKKAKIEEFDVSTPDAILESFPEMDALRAQADATRARLAARSGERGLAQRLGEQEALIALRSAAEQSGGDLDRMLDIVNQYGEESARWAEYSAPRGRARGATAPAFGTPERVQWELDRKASGINKQRGGMRGGGVDAPFVGPEASYRVYDDILAHALDNSAIWASRVPGSQASIRAADRELKVLLREARRAEQNAARLGGRAAGTTARQAETQSAIARLQSELDAIMPRYQRAQEAASQMPRDRGSIPLAGLEAYAFPYEMADEAARELQKETRNPGTVDAALRAVNGVFRGIQATGEMSYLGIQNAIGTFADPVAGGRAAKASVKAWLNAGDEVLGDFITRFDARTAQKGRPSSEQWAASGLRLGGAGTEFRVGGRKLPERVANVMESRPVQIATTPVRSLVKRADRGFGVAGDTMRLELADTLAEEAKLAGRTLDDKTLRNIAESANRVTGWTPQRAFGDWGEAVNFAPRYLAARARALGQLASRDPQKRELAMRLMGRYLMIASTMTIAANYLNGEETDYRPFSGKQGPTFDPRKAEYKNPNFMRVMNVAGRDWSLLGPMDALLGTVVGAGSLVTNPTGDPKQMLERVRSIFTAPLASTGLDWLVFGEDFDGNKLTLDSEAGARNLLGRVLPFATSDLGSSAMETARLAQEKGAGAAATEAVAGTAQGFFGGRGSLQTPREQVERGRYGELTPDRQFQAIPAQSWRLVRESGQDVGGYQTYNQWRTAKVGEIAEYLRGTGVSSAEAKLQAETLVERMPTAQLYSRLRNAYETMWIAQNAENAGQRLDVEVEKPGMERRFTPNQRERQIIEAAR